MNPVPAFTAPAPATTFTSSRAAVISQRPALRVTTPSTHHSVSMIWNPFSPKKENQQQQQQPETAFMEPQAGDPGYTPLPKVPKGFGMEKSPEAKDSPPTDAKAAPTKVAQKLPVASGEGPIPAAKRGLDLLREDLFKSAPERAGVGRQDTEGLVMKPVAGEPGYKAPSIATVKVSELGISPFPDDKNFVTNVGGIEAVKKAAVDAKAGKSAKQLKKEALASLDKPAAPVKAVARAAPSIPNVSATASAQPAAVPAPVAPLETEDLLPSYLKPLPEDTPRKGMTWKNYVGR